MYFVQDNNRFEKRIYDLQHLILTQEDKSCRKVVVVSVGTTCSDAVRGPSRRTVRTGREKRGKSNDEVAAATSDGARRANVAL